MLRYINYDDNIESYNIVGDVFVNEKVFFEARKSINKNKSVAKDNILVRLINQDGAPVGFLKDEKDIIANNRDCAEVPPLLQIYDDEFVNLNYQFVDSWTAYYFEELEEYTYYIACVLSEKYPEKKIVFNKCIAAFYELFKDKTWLIEELCDRLNNKYLVITSDNINYEDGTANSKSNEATNMFNSINVVYSLIWSAKHRYYDGRKREILLVLDFKSRGAGLMDYVKFAYAYYLVAESLGWNVYVDLSGKPNQYSDHDGDNVWEYFFEQFNSVSGDDLQEYSEVIYLSDNNQEMHSAIFNPLLRKFLSHDFLSNIILNDETKKFVEKKHLEYANKGTKYGVIARGTDYSAEQGKLIGRAYCARDVNVLIEEVSKRIPRYQYVFLATEDEDYFEKFQNAFGDKLLFIDQPRAKYKKKHYESYTRLSEVIKFESGKEFGRLYLAVIYELSKCSALMANIANGTFFAAKSLNGDNYDECIII